jgi:Rrf2 family nitric oxide-sensitive transcriptional repressor
MRLHMAPADINIGVLVRETEQDLSIVECFSSKNACKISPVCGLKGMFNEAITAFLNTLDQYTLEDVIPPAQRTQLLRLLQIAS